MNVSLTDYKGLHRFFLLKVSAVLILGIYEIEISHHFFSCW